jgi:hypothetical protein
MSKQLVQDAVEAFLGKVQKNDDMAGKTALYAVTWSLFLQSPHLEISTLKPQRLITKTKYFTTQDKANDFKDTLQKSFNALELPLDFTAITYTTWID